MKKILSVTMTILMLLGCMNLTVFAEDETLSANVYVTIADKGNLVVTQEEVYVTDIDDDNKLTINDALYATHEAKYDGGAGTGYATSVTDWGLSIAKLWGDTSYNFGYYVNNASAWSLADEVKDGDYINAFIYSDGQYYSDTFCYFDVNSVKEDAGKDITLTLKTEVWSYDASADDYVSNIEGVAGATITVDGVKTSVKTDANGAATIQIADGGNYVISAVSDTQILVPPVCKVTVSAASQTNTNTDTNTSTDTSTDTDANTDTNTNTNTNVASPKTGDNTNVSLLGICMMISFCGIIVLNSRRKKSYEK